MYVCIRNYAATYTMLLQVMLIRFFIHTKLTDVANAISITIKKRLLKSLFFFVKLYVIIM